MGDASIDLDGSLLCYECGLPTVPQDGLFWYCPPCTTRRTGPTGSGVVHVYSRSTAREQAPWHSAEIERLRARVAELEARPTVHPLALGCLRGDILAAEAGWEQEQSDAAYRLWDQWIAEGRPLTATGGEVLAPGEPVEIPPLTDRGPPANQRTYLGNLEPFSGTMDVGGVRYRVHGAREKKDR